MTDPQAPAAPTPEFIAAQVQDRSRRLIKTTGEVIPYPEPVPPDAIPALIGATILDTVNLRHFGYPLVVMSIDDRAYETETVDHGMVRGPSGPARHFENRPVRALKPVNEIATALYHANCYPGVTHQILGDVFVAPDDDFATPENPV